VGYRTAKARSLSSLVFPMLSCSSLIKLPPGRSPFHKVRFRRGCEMPSSGVGHLEGSTPEVVGDPALHLSGGEDRPHQARGPDGVTAGDEAP